MFFAVISHPMSVEEESALLLATGCSSSAVSSLIKFATKYRENMSTNTTVKNRKLGTRTLVRIARRIAKFPWDDDLHLFISRAVLAEFLPPAERLNLIELLEEAGIQNRTDLVRRSDVTCNASSDKFSV